MREALSINQKTSFGQMLKNIRTSLQLTQQEVSERFGVSVEDVDLFERDLPVRLGTKIKILRQLYIPQALENHD